MPTVDLPALLSTTPRTPEWIVESMLPRDTLTVLVGLEGIGKSSLAYSLALCVATGTAFLGRHTQQRRVLYFDSENSLPDCGQYVRQLWIGLQCPDVSVLNNHLRIEHFALSFGWQDVFKTVCHDWHPDLIIIDTANSCFSIKDENSNAEAADILSKIHKYRPPQSSVLLMKHEREPKEGAGKSVRGAKYWLSAVDQVIYLHRQPGRPLTEETLHKTRLVPAKHRAFGLETTIQITPERILGPLGKGLIFHTKA